MKSCRSHPRYRPQDGRLAIHPRLVGDRQLPVVALALVAAVAHPAQSAAPRICVAPRPSPGPFARVLVQFYLFHNPIRWLNKGEGAHESTIIISTIYKAKKMKEKLQPI